MYPIFTHIHVEHTHTNTYQRFAVCYLIITENQKLKVVNLETTNALRVQKSEFVQKNRVLSPKATSEIRPDHPSLLDLQNETVFIHKDLAGAIIGPFGSRIRAIRGSSNATIVIGEEIMGNNKRTITITGTPQQIKIAKVLMQIVKNRKILLRKSSNFGSQVHP